MNERNWKATTQDYRRGFVEGESGARNAFLLEVGATNIEEYNRGFADGIRLYFERTPAPASDDE